VDFIHWLVGGITWSFDVLLHLDIHLHEWALELGPWCYVLVFAVIFAESGIFIFPFLPGDSLLFALGALCARGTLDRDITTLSLIIAAIAGGFTNYAIGQWIGPRIYKMGDRLYFKQSHITKTHQFYEKHGGKTILLARFIPIIRTFAAFVAGIAYMDFRKFALFNVLGGIVWVVSLVYLGFHFGNLPIIRDNFGLVIPMIIVISVLPILWEIVSKRLSSFKTPR